ncbi:hypothetical protein ABTX81_12095 [Kitasatospora sp. NPDC097605]|uniref:hypothetical protein n=1 Tax=Kitasatospora sp. NPDC097605 TaxID=3157226 RepID=UPI0033211470
MTVLHSRNADAADAAGSADVKDTTDTKAATETADSTDRTDSTDTMDTKDSTEQAETADAAPAADTDLREDLGRYAELGAFTLTAGTHPWYAAVDTIATPEEARAASTVLAELRGHDLQQVWDDVNALAADVKLDAPDTVGKTAVLVEMLQLVRRTSTVLAPAAYDADLEALIAATADRNWRRERGVKLSWLRGRSLRKQAGALAATTNGRPRAQDLHEALASAEVERRAWAALAPAGTLPTAPSDADLAHRTAQTFEAISTGVRELDRLLPGQDLDALSFPDLVDLVERLAADEGTLYRLPTLRGLRATLEDGGLADLLTELAAAHADRRAAEAAYAARQALAGGQRDGLATETTETAEEPEAAVAEDTAEDTAESTDESTDEAAVEPTAETEAVAEAASDPAEAEAEPEEQPLTVTLPAPSPAADDLVGITAAPPVQPSAPDAEAIAPAPVEADPEAAPVEAEAVVADTEPASVEVEVEPAAETPVVAEPVVETAVEVEPVAEVPVEVEAEPAVETPAEVTAVVAEAEVALAEVVAEPVVETVVEAEPVAEVPVEVEAEPAVETPAEAAAVVAEAEVALAEVVAEPVVETVVEAEPVAEVPVEVEAEPAVETPAEAAAVVAEAESVPVEVEPVAETPAEAEPVAEVSVEAEPVAEVGAEPVAEPVAEEPVEPAEAAAETPAELTDVVADAEPAAAEVEPVVEPSVEVVAESVVEAAAEEAPEPVAEVVAEAEAVEEAVEEALTEPVAEVAVEAPADEVAEPAAEAGGRPEKPDFTPGRPVTAYSAEELLAIVRWVDGDGVERSDEELLRAAMKELGFARLGPRIKEALGAAVTAARG